MRSFRIFAALAIISAGLVISTPAEAKKDKAAAETGAIVNPFDGVPVIANCGISAFDEVFAKAGTIQTNVHGIYDGLSSARTNVNTVMGVGADAPLATALEGLKTNAAGKLSIAMDGTMPKLKASDAVPENVTKALDAVNGLVTAGAKAVTDSAALVDQVKELVAAAKGFPMKLPTLLPTLTPELVKTAPGITKDNVKAVGALPDQIKAIADQVTGIFGDIKGVFGG